LGVGSGGLRDARSPLFGIRYGRFTEPPAARIGRRS
jgi:hypothetical protein